MIGWLSSDYPKNDYVAQQPHMKVYIYNGLYYDVCIDTIHSISKWKIDKLKKMVYPYKGMLLSHKREKFVILNCNKDEL